jgi:phosphatidylglycerophosphate synthase
VNRAAEHSATGTGERLRAAVKKRDAWWAHWVVGPLANRIVGAVAPYGAVTPNRVTLVSLLVGMAAAFCFAVGTPAALRIGAIVLQASFVLDCVDGQLARFRGESTLFGAALDKLCDRVKLFAVTFALAAGLARSTGDAGWFVPALVYFFAESMIEQYVTVYRKLEEGAVSRAGPASRAAEAAFAALRALDLPIVRLGFADRYFLISALTLAAASGACLKALVALGLLQVTLRPVYYAAAYRSRFGVWPWNDERAHRLGENF